MNYKELEKINYELFDTESELLSNIKFGTPWVEMIMMYAKNSNYKGSASKLMIEIASKFEEDKKLNSVIYDGNFKACRLPSLDEVKIGFELIKKNNRISSLIIERMNLDNIKFINGLSRESQKTILKEIDFEISSVRNLYYLLGYQLIDNRNLDCIYGVLSNGKIQKITKDGILFDVSLSELSGIDTGSAFNTSSLF